MPTKQEGRNRPIKSLTMPHDVWDMAERLADLQRDSLSRMVEKLIVREHERLNALAEKSLSNSGGGAKRRPKG